jgi:hypothetical protein
VAGVVLEAVSTLNLRSYALTKAPQLMLA